MNIKTRVCASILIIFSEHGPKPLDLMALSNSVGYFLI